MVEGNPPLRWMSCVKLMTVILTNCSGSQLKVVGDRVEGAVIFQMAQNMRRFIGSPYYRKWLLTSYDVIYFIKRQNFWGRGRSIYKKVNPLHLEKVHDLVCYETSRHFEGIIFTSSKEHCRAIKLKHVLFEPSSAQRVSTMIRQKIP